VHKERSTIPFAVHSIAAMKITFANAFSVSLFESIVGSFFFHRFYQNSTPTSFFVAFLLCNLPFVMLYKLVLYPFMLSPLKHFPRARGFLPFVGHSWTLIRRPPGEAHLEIMKETDNSEGLILFQDCGHENRVMAVTPAAIAEVLVCNSFDYETPLWTRIFLRKFLGNGLLTTEGDEHKHHRRLDKPAFYASHFKELHSVFWSRSMKFCDAVKAGLMDRPTDVLEIGHFSTQVTLDIIGLAAIGRDIDSLSNREDELLGNYKELFEPATEKGVFSLVHLILPPWFIDMLPWKLNDRLRITTSNLKRMCTKFVAERKVTMKGNNHDSIDVLSTMIRSNTFSDKDLVDQLLTFLAAG
jgi:cytochrome P450